MAPEPQPTRQWAPTAVLSSVQRSEQMDRTVEQVSGLTIEFNKIAKRSSLHTEQFKALQQRIDELADGRCADRARVERFIDGRSFWQRVRWVVTGR